jgi:hypothetical protein
MTSVCEKWQQISLKFIIELLTSFYVIFDITVNCAILETIKSNKVYSFTKIDLDYFPVEPGEDFLESLSTHISL